MSRAFVREAGAETAGALPDRPISPHPNFVTRSGADKIEARLRELEATRSTALAADDRASIADVERELRYWKQRRSSARVIAPPAAPEIVRFGVTVRLRFDQGGDRHYQLVGEDEADPPSGLLSWTSPVGSALIGRRTGDVVEVCGQQAQIVAMQG
jgi:transcription elongation GreA/GreB family factor